MARSTKSESGHSEAGTWLDVFTRTTDAVVAVDTELNIVAWNDGATALFGRSAADTLGKPCHEVLAWTDRHGNPACADTCMAAVPGDDLVATCDVVAPTADGRNLWLDVTTFVPPLELQETSRLVHVARESTIARHLESAAGADRRDPAAEVVPSPLDDLTPREREVLDLLTEGLNGTAIAQRLVLSPATVRNHIQHILATLGVHSRMEAVALALRHERRTLR